MSTETEIRVGNLLDSSQEVVTVGGPSAVSSQGVKPSSSGASITSAVSKLEIDTAKEGLSVELKQNHEKMKVLLAKLSRSQHSWMLSFLWNNCYEHLLKLLINIHLLITPHVTLLVTCREVIVWRWCRHLEKSFLHSKWNLSFWKLLQITRCNFVFDSNWKCHFIISHELTW